MITKETYQVQSSQRLTEKFQCVPVYYTDFTDLREAIDYYKAEYREGNVVSLKKLSLSKDSYIPTYELIEVQQ